MAVTAGIYAIMALGMNVIWGMAGLINLGLVGFFAVGAYTSALLTLKFGWPIAGGGATSRLGVRDSVTGWPTKVIAALSFASTGCAMPMCLTCGSANIWSIA